MHCAHFHSLHCTEERPADRRLAADVEAAYHDLAVSTPLLIDMSTSKAQRRSWVYRLVTLPTYHDLAVSAPLRIGMSTSKADLGHLGWYW